ncbi:hypothetical protein cypCar_00038214 [Cyprinus carpio]|nr:hypothetical protein cypCar_00038214 [Cyprinus carpio]
MESLFKEETQLTEATGPTAGDDLPEHMEKILEFSVALTRNVYGFCVWMTNKNHDNDYQRAQPKDRNRSAEGDTRRPPSRESSRERKIFQQLMRDWEVLPHKRICPSAEETTENFCKEELKEDLRTEVKVLEIRSASETSPSSSHIMENIMSHSQTIVPKNRNNFATM